MTTSETTTPQKTRGVGTALAVIASCRLMAVLDTTIVISHSRICQTALRFSATFGGLLLLDGRAGDIPGRRRAFISGALCSVHTTLPNALAAAGF
jgi:hypothetical protein